MAFYAFAFAAGLHHLYLTRELENTTLEPLVCQSYRTKAISLVRSQLGATTGAPTDDLIVSILILAAHGAKREKVSGYSHPQSPLATVQMLDFYGSLEYETAHQFGLYYLVKQEGGLDKVQMEGLSKTLQL